MIDLRTLVGDEWAEWYALSLLLGGQACVLYGGAEFSRDPFS